MFEDNSAMNYLLFSIFVKDINKEVYYKGSEDYEYVR